MFNPFIYLAKISSLAHMHTRFEQPVSHLYNAGIFVWRAHMYKRACLIIRVFRSIELHTLDEQLICFDEPKVTEQKEITSKIHSFIE